MDAPQHYCQAWERDEDGSPLCYHDTVGWSMVDGELVPVCEKHRRELTSAQE